ncbi:replicative DNA helicase, partial [Candidatus Aerophobetes bacterium]|nr:replicative DNA helicase [Candidatus Aerophobetes bacterium]
MKAKTESTSGLGKVPPQNLEAERAVLGGMLLERETIPKVLQIITESESFYSEVHTLIYEGVVSLFNQNKPVDVVALKEQFGKKGKLKEVGGASYLAELVNSVPTTVNVPYYAQIVKQKHILRDLLKTADFIRSLSYDDSQELDVVLDKAQSSIFDITQQRVQTPYQHIKDVLTGTFERIEALYERK